MRTSSAPNYRAVFEHVPDPPGSRPRSGHELDFRGDDPEPACHRRGADWSWLPRRRSGSSATVRRWLSGRVRALRSSRARDLMTTMVPSILVALGRQPNPDEAFSRFDRFMSALPAGVQPMSLFQRNPQLLDRIAAVLGAAPMLAEHLARNPSALEGLLATEEDVDARRMLRTRIADANTLEDAIQIVRRAVKERDFFLSVATLEGRLDADASGLQRTALAEAAVSVLVPRVLADFATRFGRVPRRRARGGGDGQGGRAGDDGRLRSRPDVHLRPSGGGDRKPRRAQPARQPMVRPRGAGLHRRADRAGTGGPDVRARHAAAAIRATRGRSPFRWRRSGATTRPMRGPGSAWR